MIKQEEWLDNLRMRVQDAEYVKAPQGLLDDVKGELARRGVAPTKAAGKSTLHTLWGVIGATSAAAILAVGILVSGVFNHTSSSSSSTTTLKTENADVRYDDASTTELPAEQPSVLDQMRRNLRSSALVPATHYMASHSLVEANQKQTTTATATDNPWKMEYKADNEDTNSPSQSDPPVIKTTPNTPKTHQVEQQPLLALSNNKKSGFSIGVSYMGGTTVSHNTRGTIMVLSEPYREINSELPDENQKHDIVAYDEMITSSKHSQPVKFGMSVRYHLNDRWSLQSGLTYSLLSSEFSSQKKNERTTCKQTLHYVGVPLSVNYNFIKTKYINIYATAGGEAEKLVSGTMKYSSSSADQLETSSGTAKEKALQFSVNTAIGAEFKLSNSFSIYAEPGMTHYFNNGSKVDNTYKKTPTRFNVNAGFRVNINQIKP